MMQMGTLRRACVAVVDDDENLRRSFARLLRAAGMLPTTYPSAEAFLTDTMHTQFDCLVLDVQLPGMSGLELQEQLSAKGVATPILFITAYDDPLSRERAYAVGCAGYFRKTDSGSEVLNAIDKVIVQPLGGA
jgi:FixJ family two-component response regulator